MMGVVEVPKAHPGRSGQPPQGTYGYRSATVHHAYTPCAQHHRLQEHSKGATPEIVQKCNSSSQLSKGPIPHVQNEQLHNAHTTQCQLSSDLLYNCTVSQMNSCAQGAKIFPFQKLQNSSHFKRCKIIYILNIKIWDIFHFR